MQWIEMKFSRQNNNNTQLQCNCQRDGRTFCVRDAKAASETNLLDGRKKVITPAAHVACLVEVFWRLFVHLRLFWSHLAVADNATMVCVCVQFSASLV